MAILLQHTFTGADSTAGIPNADTGQVVAISSGVFGTRSNKAYWISGTAIRAWDVANADVQITVDRILNSGTARTGSVGFRFTDANNYFFFRWSAGSLQLYKVQAGTATQIGANVSLSTAIATVYKFKVVLLGSSIKCYVDDVEYFNVTDIFNQTATIHGIRNHLNNTEDYDNLLVESLTSGTTYTGSGTSDGLSTVISAEKLLLKATGTTRGFADVSAIASLILKAMGSAQGLSSVTSSETATLQAGTTYTGNGTAQGISGVTSAEIQRYKASGNAQGLANVASNELVVYLGNGMATGFASVTGSETVTHQAGTTYPASGTTQGISSVASIERMILSAMGAVQGKTDVTANEVMVLLASGITQGYSTVTVIDNFNQIIGSIRLKGQRVLNIILEGQRVSNIQLKGQRVQNVILKGSVGVTAKNQNFTTTAGDSFQPVFPCTELKYNPASKKMEEAPVNFTGCTFKWVLKKAVDSTEHLVSKTLDTGITVQEDTVLIQLDKADTESLGTAYPYYHECEMTDQQGHPSTLFTGRATIEISGV
jgi:hypothetical protein